MSEIEQDQLSKKIAELEQELEQYVQRANLEIAFMRGQIAALKEMLKADEQPKDET
jgi:protein-arginine kinase activator protein McsA